jgi:hypothetical protein
MMTQNGEQTTPFLSLTSSESIDELFLRSEDRPVVLFKHSSTCPISSAAYREMQEVKNEVAIVVIRHESPQIIILRKGAAVWNASHWNIKADAVARAIDENR